MTGIIPLFFFFSNIGKQYIYIFFFIVMDHDLSDTGGRTVSS